MTTMTSPTRPERQIHIHNSTDLATYRSWTKIDLFGSDALPSEIGALESVSSPISGLTDLDRCERIVMTSYTSRPRVWYPTTPNGDAMIVMPGHSETYTTKNTDNVIQSLITNGYTAIGLVMPDGVDEVTGSTSGDHGANEPPLENFIGQICIAINTLEGGLTNIHSMGRSGGAWMTTVVAAIDTRIKKSYPWLGTLPSYMHVSVSGNGSRDWEQYLPGLRASYLDLYIMGSTGAGRRQKQILFENDPCCFNREDYETGYPYADLIAQRASDLGGDYDLVWKNHNVHEFVMTYFTDEVLAEI